MRRAVPATCLKKVTNCDSSETLNQLVLVSILITAQERNSIDCRKSLGLEAIHGWCNSPAGNRKIAGESYFRIFKAIMNLDDFRARICERPEGNALEMIRT